MKRTAAGFTLIELMIVVVIIAVLLAIAIPSFNEYIRRSRRAEAIAGLQQMQLAQERWRSNNPTYGAGTDIGLPQSPYYTFSVSGNTATNYTLTATRAGAQTTDTTCGNYSITQTARTAPATGVDITKSPSPISTSCWK